MSRMLQALKNLSSRGAGGPTPQESVAPTQASAAAALDAPATVDADPVLPPVNHSRRMKDLLVKHLSAPTATEVFRKPAAAGPVSPEGTDSSRGELEENDEFHSTPAGNMTVSMDALSSQLTAPAARQTAAPAPKGMDAFLPPVVDIHDSPGVESIASVTDLLATIEDDADSHGEEISLSFASEAERIQVLGLGRQESGDRDQESGDGGQGSEVRDQTSEVRIQSSEVRGQRSEVSADSLTPARPDTLTPAILTRSHPHTPAPAVLNTEPRTLKTSAEPETRNPKPETPAAASPLDHLADARPLVTYQPDDEPDAAAQAPPALPIRKISRGKTRLEQRVLDNLSHPSHSLPYRELADRLAQDLRLLTGRCLLFTGVGSASHADDVLSHVAALMAEDDAEVVLVDADFTRAAITVGLGALKETGLGELPDGNNSIQELVLPTLLPNLSLIPAGRKSLPDSLGVVDQMAELLAKLEERYALVLIDGGTHTGPLVPALARLCDATYFVVRLGATDARAASTALKAFRATGARVMGCVATSAPAAACA